jgi:glycosyltransferase involved in cell wall biosynthesis
MKLSIITVCRNSAGTIAKAVDSVALQSNCKVEHIVVDGASTDHTMSILRERSQFISQLISEPDQGLYDAMNKGIDLATGDVIGLLNSDDFYPDNFILSKVIERFEKKNVDAVICDVGFFNEGRPKRIIRRYNSAYFRPSRLGWGWMPAHPGIFLTKAAYDRIGLYRTDYSIAADFEFVARAFGKHRITFEHLAEIAVMMRIGGVSTSGFKAKLTINKEVLRACRENGIYSNPAMLVSKYPRKILEMIL